MPRRITRRDFLDGVALTAAAMVAPVDLLAAPAAASPPMPTGERGSPPRAFAVAHALRDGARFEPSRARVEDTCDLVVIGAGISGLSAAHFHRVVHPGSRVLILENHDDFGGHARRNEFRVNGRTLIGYGGSEAIQSPGREWSAEALGLLSAVGIDVDRLGRAFDQELYPGLGLSRAVFFTRESFGADRLVSGDPTYKVDDDIPANRTNARPVDRFVADFPLPADQRDILVSVYRSDRNVLPGMSAEETARYLSRISYRDFLVKHWALSEQAAAAFQGRSLDLFAIGADALSARDAMHIGYPGFRGLTLPPTDGPPAAPQEPYIYHFPDGNASVARALVRALIPGCAPGLSMEDLVTARFDYSRLDRRGSAVRLRLNSTVVRIENVSSGLVDVAYVRQGRLHRVRAPRVVYAGYGSMLPYLCPDIGRRQAAALAAAVKAPLVYVTIAVRRWHAWVTLGVHEITNPMGFFSRVKLDYPVSLGSYRCPTRPEQPMLLHLVHVPTVALAGLDQRAAWRAGRAALLATSFPALEARVRDELTRMLGPGGFDADRDIAAITVNRWGHGYAYGSNSLFDTEAEPPVHEIARATIGHVAIAGSDAAWSAYAQAAIDEAHRAVREI